MRFLLIFLSVIGCVLLAARGPSAQQPGGRLSAEQRDIGRVETRIQKYNQALGVTTRLTRPLGADSECHGICFFPSSSRPVSWQCAPSESCELHCDVNPPVGGCH